MLLLAFALQLQDPDFARAESLFAAHDLRAARTVAERLVGNHPADATAHLLLGRIWFAWPTVGRYQALSEFKTAERLAPNDLQPLYWQTQVGDFLGGAEDGHFYYLANPRSKGEPSQRKPGG